MEIVLTQTDKKLSTVKFLTTRKSSLLGSWAVYTRAKLATVRMAVISLARVSMRQVPSKYF